MIKIFILYLTQQPAYSLSAVERCCNSFGQGLAPCCLTLNVYCTVYTEQPTKNPLQYRARICNPIKEPRNRFSAWRDGTTSLFVVPARQATEAAESIPRNRFLGSINVCKYGLSHLSNHASHQLIYQQNGTMGQYNKYSL